MEPSLTPTPSGLPNIGANATLYCLRLFELTFPLLVAEGKNDPSHWKNVDLGTSLIIYYTNYFV